MTDALSYLEAKNKKLAKQIEQLRAKLDAAESEFNDNQTAIKVLSRIGVTTPIEQGTDDPKKSSQDEVLRVIPVNVEKALTPREVHQALEAAGSSIKADNVRTILLRLKNAKTVFVTDAGKYWRNEQGGAGDFNGYTDFDDLDDLPGTAVSGPPRPQPIDFDDDLDSDAPF